MKSIEDVHPYLSYLSNKGIWTVLQGLICRQVYVYWLLSNTQHGVNRRAQITGLRACDVRYGWMDVIALFGRWTLLFSWAPLRFYGLGPKDVHSCCLGVRLKRASPPLYGPPRAGHTSSVSEESRRAGPFPPL